LRRLGITPSDAHVDVGGVCARQADPDPSQVRPPFSVDPATGAYSTTVPSPTGIPNDPPLTSHGVDQAKQLASHLLVVDPQIDQVYSSPFYRCLQTIAPFVRAKNETSSGNAVRSRLATSEAPPVPGIRAEQGFGEWFGLAPFEHPAAAPLTMLQASFPEMDSDYQSQVLPCRYGESLVQLHNRVAAALRAIIKRSDEEGHKAVVICSHAAVIISIGRVLTGRIPEQVEEEDFFAYTCGLSTYERLGGNIRVEGPEVTAKEEPRSPTRVHAADNSLPASILPASRSSGTKSAGIVDPRLISVSRDKVEPSWKDGIDAIGGWTCKINSDCAFLRGGEERGW
jgi:transcription factor C subunit 7